MGLLQERTFRIQSWAEPLPREVLKALKVLKYFAILGLFLRLDFAKTIVKYQISTLKFIKTQTFIQKNPFRFVTNNTLFYYWAVISKSYCHI